MTTPNLEDYVPVNERIAKFYERFPDGRLTREKDWTIQRVGEQDFIVYHALAYRTADDPHPGQGVAWEPFPGKTNFTRESELMNAETAAWGRAIAACGIEVHNGIATQQDVRNRSGDGSDDGGQQVKRASAGSQDFYGPAPQDKRVSEGRVRRAHAIKKQHNITMGEWALLLEHFQISEPEELHFRAYDEFCDYLERKQPMPDEAAQDIQSDIDDLKPQEPVEDVPF